MNRSEKAKELVYLIDKMTNNLLGQGLEILVKVNEVIEEEDRRKKIYQPFSTPPVEEHSIM